MVSQGLMRQLRELSPQDWQDVSARLSALHQFSGGAVLQHSTHTTRVVEPLDYLLEGIHHELRRRGLLSSKEGLGKHVFPVGFASKSATVWARLEEVIGLDLSPKDKTALGRLAGRALAGWLESQRIPVTGGTLTKHVVNVVVALDAAFPGYLAAGVLQACWSKYI